MTSVPSEFNPSYLVGARHNAENLPHVLNLKTPVVTIAPKFRQQHSVPQHIARLRAPKFHEPRIINPAFIAKKNMVMLLSA